MQISLEKLTKQYITINTHMGLYRYSHLPFGFSVALATFQRTIKSLLPGMPRVSVDILVTSTSEADQLKALDKVLSHLETAG